MSTIELLSLMAAVIYAGGHSSRLDAITNSTRLLDEVKATVKE